MSVACSSASASSAFTRWPGLWGRNPPKGKASVGRPEAASAARDADGPGIARTGMPFSMAARTSRKPGSDTSGMPAVGVVQDLELLAQAIDQRGEIRLRAENVEIA